MESSGCISTRCPHPEVGIEGGGALERLLPEEMQLGVSSSIGGTAPDWFLKRLRLIGGVQGQTSGELSSAVTRRSFLPLIM